MRGGRASTPEKPEDPITSLDVVWLKYKSPAPGSTGVEVTGRDVALTYQKGARDGGAPPTLKNLNVR